jgi:hypothetical protein
MKIISLFTKAPQHQKFSYRPRYYDPSKDEMKEREERIRKEIERERGVVVKADEGYRTRIAGSFQAARKRSKPTAEKSAVLVRFGAILFMVLLLFAFLEWGRPALYGAFLAIPIYFYMKFRDISNKQRD